MDKNDIKTEIDRLNNAIKELQVENARYRDALEFYKNPQRIDNGPLDWYYAWDNTKARKALRENDEA